MMVHGSKCSSENEVQLSSTIIQCLIAAGFNSIRTPTITANESSQFPGGGGHSFMYVTEKKKRKKKAGSQVRNRV